MNKTEISTVANLRNRGMTFPDIADKLKLSVDAVKRRWYAHKNDQKDPYQVPFVKPKAGPKILFFDIETAPILGYVWKPWEDNLIRTEHDWFMLSYAYRWEGDTDYNVVALPDFRGYKKNMKCDKSLVKSLWDIFDQADIIVAHNGDAFDIKKANARFIGNGMLPPSGYRTIDTLKVARQNFKFSRNSLNELGIALNLGQKIVHTGANLWFGCMEGDQESWEIMKQYNIQDVVLLEKVYYRLRPWMKSHPNLRIYEDMPDADCCPKCSSISIIKKGFNYTQATKRQAYRCNDCGGWFSAGPSIKKKIVAKSGFKAI